jgi:hypothetical protein
LLLFLLLLLRVFYFVAVRGSTQYSAKFSLSWLYGLNRSPKKVKSPWPVDPWAQWPQWQVLEDMLHIGKGKQPGPVASSHCLGAVDHSERRKVCLVISKAFFLHGPVFPHGTPFGKSSPQLNKVFVCNRNDFRHLLYVILSLINCLPTYAQLTINSNLLVTWDIHCHRPLLSVNCCRSWCTVYIYIITHTHICIYICVRVSF